MTDCFTCGNDARLTVAWLHRDKSSGREWTGTDRPSCLACAIDDATGITPDSGLHGSRVHALTIRPIGATVQRTRPTVYGHRTRTNRPTWETA